MSEIEGTNENVATFLLDQAKSSELLGDTLDDSLPALFKLSLTDRRSCIRLSIHTG